jgi:hypothetical protein
MDEEEKAIKKFLNALDELMEVSAKKGGSWKERAERLIAYAEENDQETNLEELAGWLEEM